MSPPKGESPAVGGTTGGAKSQCSGERAQHITATREVARIHRFFDRQRRIDPARHRRAVQRVRAAWRELGEAIADLDALDAEDERS